MKIVKIIIFLLISNPSLANNLTNDKFERKKLGFSISKPSDWQFVSEKEHLEKLKSIKIANEDLREQLIKLSPAPLVAMVKHKEPFSNLNPSFKINVKPIGKFANSIARITKTREILAKEILEEIIPNFKQILNNFKVRQKPVSLKISGLDAAYARFDYSLPVIDKKILRVASQIWIIPQKNYYYLIGSITRQDEETGSRDEIKKIIDSIKISTKSN